MQRKFWAACTLATILFFFSTRIEAITVMSFSVEELAARAEKVFVGTCTNVSHKVNDRGVPVVEVTFAVAETIKGEVGSTVTFQQFDAQTRLLPPSAAANDRIRELPQGIFAKAALIGMPTYRLREEVVLFLAAPGKLGLTSPIGLVQGKLPITTLASGEKMVTNTALRKTATTNSTLPDPGKTARYDHFLKALRTVLQTTTN
jgi:hypothetical protein